MYNFKLLIFNILILLDNNLKKKKTFIWLNIPFLKLHTPIIVQKRRTMKFFFSVFVHQTINT